MAERTEKNTDYSQYSPMALAYIGDAVFNLYIREKQLEKGDIKTGLLHKEAISYVSASAQSSIVDSIIDSFSADEKFIYKRGRNTNSPTVPKNTKPGDYRKATGFEAVIGYLYLLKREKRLTKIMELSYEAIESRG
jgi:ribonuclease-3 family protein